MGTPSYVSMDDVQTLVEEQLAKVREEHEAALLQVRIDSDARVDNLQAQLDAARKAASPTTSVPWNAGGLGDAIHETWSQAEQARAHAAAEAEGEALASKAA
jgi:hypothetical protein